MDGEIPPEAADLIRRALLGEDVESATLGIGEPTGEPSSPSVHFRDHPQVEQTWE